MALASLVFLIFLFVTAIVYYIIPKRYQWLVLLVASLIFYLSSGLALSLYLIFTTFVVYCGSLIVNTVRTRETGGGQPNKEKYAFVVTLIAAMFPLVFLKYGGFVSVNIGDILSIFGTRAEIPILNFAIPLGISFYTFQIVGYLIDIYRGVCEFQKNPLKLALFASFFPSVSLGPINRYNDLFPQMTAAHSFNYEQVTFGAQRVLWGFFKKMVIADRIAIFVDCIHNNPVEYTGLYAVFAAVAFVFQLYADFSGCMDIVIGSAQIFDIDMPENFRTPFGSHTIAEFWRRWHITLGGWMKDYLFYPLLRTSVFQKIAESLEKLFGKKRARKLTTYIGMFVLWFVMGVWHGASWNFIIGTGLLHWFYMVSGEVSKPLNTRITILLKIKTESFLWTSYQRLRTFILVCIGLVFFRADDFKDAINFFLSTFKKTNFDQALLLFGLDSLKFTFMHMFILCVALSVLFTASFLQERYYVRRKISEQKISLRWIMYYILIFSIICLQSPGVNAVREFLYANF